jgi:hypothetical protein
MQEENRAHGHSPEVERRDTQSSAGGRSYPERRPGGGVACVPRSVQVKAERQG